MTKSEFPTPGQADFLIRLHAVGLGSLKSQIKQLVLQLKSRKYHK